GVAYRCGEDAGGGSGYSRKRTVDAGGGAYARSAGPVAGRAVLGAFPRSRADWRVWRWKQGTGASYDYDLRFRGSLSARTAPLWSADLRRMPPPARANLPSDR